VPERDRDDGSALDAGRRGVGRRGYPLDAGGILLVEVDGVRDGLDDLLERIETICRASHATQLRVATTALERDKLWAGRKGAFAAMGRLASDYYVQDGVIPRTKLPQVLRHVIDVGERYGLRIANVFHAGDGNLHPLIMFDGSKGPAEVERVKEAGREILEMCIEVGGSITGSTASAWRRTATCRSSTRRSTWP